MKIKPHSKNSLDAFDSVADGSQNISMNNSDPPFKKAMPTVGFVSNDLDDDGTDEDEESVRVVEPPVDIMELMQTDQVNSHHKVQVPTKFNYNVLRVSSVKWRDEFESG